MDNREGKTSADTERSLMQDWNVIRKVFTLAARLNPWSYIASISHQVLESLGPFANIILASLILNEMVGEGDTTRLIQLVAATLGINFGISLTRRILARIRLHHRDSFGLLSVLELAKATMNMDYVLAESPDMYLRRQKIREGWDMFGEISSLISQVCLFGQGLLTVVLSAGIISQLLTLPVVGGQQGFLKLVDSPAASLGFVSLIAVSLVAGYFNNRTLNRYMNDELEANVQSSRDFDYLLSTIINDYHIGQDIRLYEMAPMLESHLESQYKDISDISIFFQNRGRRTIIINQIITTLVATVTFVFVALKAHLGVVPVGSVLLYVGAISQLNQGFAAMINWYGQIRVKAALDQETIDYLSLPMNNNGTMVLEKPVDMRFEFEICNLSFKYPGSDEFVLRNINIKFLSGERVAIVGINGSGKTTLIKLLCRLYDPTEGEILLNGVNTSTYNLFEYWSLFSVVFQDYKLFSLPLGENVASSKSFDRARVEKDLGRAGFTDRLMQMTLGVYTPLFKHIDDSGVELSGGEAQKIAIARALYKDAPFIILDEPTAALDPLSEAEIYKSFNDLVGIKSAVYISHRLSSCRFCQRIIVLHDGEIIQTGCHDDLLRDARGQYARMWYAQAQHYTDKDCQGAV